MTQGAYLANLGCNTPQRENSMKCLDLRNKLCSKIRFVDKTPFTIENMNFLCSLLESKLEVDWICKRFVGLIYPIQKPKTFTNEDVDDLSLPSCHSPSRYLPPSYHPLSYPHLPPSALFPSLSLVSSLPSFNLSHPSPFILPFHLFHPSFLHPSLTAYAIRL